MKRINILITDEQHKRLSEHSKKTEISISEQIRMAINYFFDNVIVYPPITEIWDKLMKGDKL